MPDNTIDGTPDAVKAACPVWSGGKSGDNFKGLPITIGRKALLYRTHRLYLVRSAGTREKLHYLARIDQRFGGQRG